MNHATSPVIKTPPSMQITYEPSKLDFLVDFKINFMIYILIYKKKKHLLVEINRLVQQNLQKNAQDQDHAQKIVNVQDLKNVQNHQDHRKKQALKSVLDLEHALKIVNVLVQKIQVENEDHQVVM